MVWNLPDHLGQNTSGNPLSWATSPPRRWLSWQLSTTMPAEPKRKQLLPQHPKRPTWTPGTQGPVPQPPAVGPVLTSTLQPTMDPREASAVQNLIKYCGIFALKAVAVLPGGCGNKSPFAGLGTMKPEPTTTSAPPPRAQARTPGSLQLEGVGSS